MTKKILIIFSHSDFKASRINKAMLEQIADLKGITIHVLEENASANKFDIAQEQTLLESHDVIVLQFPMYWYSCPALMKQWIDDVLLHGFAFGSTGNALKGKTLVCATSAGGSAADFSPSGDYKYSVEDFFRPFEITAKFCKMTYDRPLAIYDTSNISDDDLEIFATQYRHWVSGYL